MKVIWAVIGDLYAFVRDAIKHGVGAVTHQESYDTASLYSRTYASPVAIESSTTLPLLHADAHAPGGTCYVSSVGTYLYTDPAITFDTAYSLLPYGQKVQIHKLGDRWVQVRVGVQEGWVLQEALTANAEDVLPQLHPLVAYGADNVQTIKLRAYINDQFGCARAELALTDAEYVQYRVLRSGRTIPWSDQRPRMPGTWQRKLKGRTGVHMGINPKTGAVMEYIVDDVGYLAYVDSVFPDGGIKISGVGLHEESVYTQEELPHEQWRELRPVFIEIV